MDVNSIINKLFDHFQVYTINELSAKLGIKQSILSGWKSRNSINSFKKKCREMGIYDEIFEVIQSANPSSHITHYKEDINSKLFLFNRRSLIYLYFLLHKQNIKNSIEYFEWQIKKEDESVFQSILSDFYIDLKYNNISFSGYRRETDEYINYLIKIDELDFIFQNKDDFLKSILFIAEQKR